MSRAEKRRADREEKKKEIPAIGIKQPDGNGLATAVSEVLATPSDKPVISLRGKEWPYHGGNDAVQLDSVAWNPGVVEQPRRKLAIIGFTPSRAQAPFMDPEYEIWACNKLYTHKDVPRVTRWFDLHKPDVIDQERIKFYNDVNIPVFLHDVREDVRGSVRFPKQEIEAFFREMAKGTGYDGGYFTNTISWQIAFAIWEGFEVIDIYGVDMGQECLAPWTKVLTADLRYIPASEVKVGDKLMGFDENTGPKSDGPHANRQWRETEVLGVSTAQRPSYRINFADGTDIVASAGHQWLTFGGHDMIWKRTDELVTGAHREGRPTKVVRALRVWDTDETHGGGYLAAAFDGEGSLSQSGHGDRCNGHTLRLGFSQRENAMAVRVRDALELRGFEWGETATTSGPDVWDDEAGVAVMHKPTISYTIQGGRAEILRCLGSIRPLRLLDNFDPSKVGSFQRVDAIGVKSIEFLGDHETVGFTTSTATLIVEGLASHNSEYESQRPNVEFFLGVCLGRGIEFTIPQTSDLLKATHQYGYGSDGGFRAKMLERRDEFATRKQFFLDEIEKRQIEIRQLRIEAGIVDGAMQNTMYCLRSWCVPDHTSMTSDADKLDLEPEKALGSGDENAVGVMSMDELQAADTAGPA